MVQQSGYDVFAAQEERAKEGVDEATPYNGDQHGTSLEDMKVGKLICHEDSLATEERAHRCKNGVGRCNAVRLKEEPVRDSDQFKHTEKEDDRLNDIPDVVGESGENSYHNCTSCVGYPVCTTLSPLMGRASFFEGRLRLHTHSYSQRDVAGHAP